MAHELNIFIEQLHSQKQEKINLTVSPHFLGIQENDLILDSPILISGETYITDDHLIIHLNITTKGKTRCAICNNLTELPLQGTIYESLALSDLPSSLFDYSPLIREEILLQVPLFFECQDNCPERSNLKSFLKESVPQKKSLSDNIHFPFADL